MTLKEECKENWPWIVLFVTLIIVAGALFKEFYLPLWQEANRMEERYPYKPQIQKLPMNHGRTGFVPLPPKKD